MASHHIHIHIHIHAHTMLSAASWRWHVIRIKPTRTVQDSTVSDITHNTRDSRRDACYVEVHAWDELGHAEGGMGVVMQLRERLGNVPEPWPQEWPQQAQLNTSDLNNLTRQESIDTNGYVVLVA